MSKMQSILRARTAPMIGHLSAYENNISAMIPSLYEGLDVVSRELVGYIPSVSRSATTERAAVGQQVTYHIAPAANVSDITPSNTIPNPTDQTLGSGSLTISKARAAEFGWVGEAQRALNTGIGTVSVQADMFAQALRALTNEIELDIATVAAAAASRAYGTAGTTPFASGVGDAAQIRKILDDNGAPASGRSCIISTSAGANLRTNLQLTKANEAGTSMTLRDGELLNLSGISFKESAQTINKTKGTGASATTSAAGFAVGTTTIALAAAGTGTITAGDVITFAGDTNKYVVVSGDTDVSNGGSITIAAPGLRKAIPASATAITVGNSYEASGVAFSQDALVLAARAPALPAEGDSAMDRFTIVDPRSGLPFEVSIYPLYRKVRYEVAMAWGQKAIKPAHMALLLG